MNISSSTNICDENQVEVRVQEKNQEEFKTQEESLESRIKIQE